MFQVVCFYKQQLKLKNKTRVKYKLLNQYFFQVIKVKVGESPSILVNFAEATIRRNQALAVY